MIVGQFENIRLRIYAELVCLFRKHYCGMLCYEFPQDQELKIQFIDGSRVGTYELCPLIGHCEHLAYKFPQV